MQSYLIGEIFIILIFSGVLEKAEEHKIGQEKLVPVENFTSEIGSGVKCVVKGRTVHIGKLIR